jgi:DNA-binding transcriptional LysR family regulator
MDLRQLKYFMLVSKLGSVTRASEQCHIAQPAISISIQNLEQELGVQLFDRSHKKISLTSTGHVFYRRVEDILDRVSYSLKEMDDYKKLQRGAIRIGVSPMLGAFLFPYIFSKFQKDHPQLELIVVEDGALAIKTLLERGELDVGILLVSEKAPHLEMSPIIKSEICVCLSRKHPLAALERVPFKKLKEERFILFKEGAHSRQIILAECAKHQFTPNIVISSNQITTLLNLVENDTGITFLLEPLAQGNANVLSRRLSRPLYVQAGLIWNKNRYMTNSTQAFIEAIQGYSFSLINNR